MNVPKYSASRTFPDLNRRLGPVLKRWARLEREGLPFSVGSMWPTDLYTSAEPTGKETARCRVPRGTISRQMAAWPSDALQVSNALQKMVSEHGQAGRELLQVVQLQVVFGHDVLAMADEMGVSRWTFQRRRLYAYRYLDGELNGH